MSERLRKFVNKPLSDSYFKEILKQVGELSQIKSVRLHFLKGIPSETKEDYDELGELLEQALPLGKLLRLSFVQFVPMALTTWSSADWTDGEENYNYFIHKWFKNNLQFKNLLLEYSMKSRGKWIEWQINKGGPELNNLFNNWTIRFEGTVRNRFYNKFKGYVEKRI